MYPLNTANNVNRQVFAPVFWIEDNQGCALHQCGKFKYNRIKVPIVKRGKRPAGEEEVEVPRPFIADTGLFQCSTFRKAKKRLEKLCADDSKLRISWFHIKEGKRLAYPNKKKVQTSPTPPQFIQKNWEALRRRFGFGIVDHKTSHPQKNRIADIVSGRAV